MDLLISIALILSTLIANALAFFVTIFPPPETHNRTKRCYLAVFALFAIASVALNVYQVRLQNIQHASDKAQRRAEMDKSEREIDRLRDESSAYDQALFMTVADARTGISGLETQSRLDWKRVSRQIESLELTSAQISPLAPRVPKLNIIAPSVPSSTPPPFVPPELRRQALALARDIDGWIATVSPHDPASNPQYTNVMAFTDRLNSEWRDKFEKPANDLVAALHVQGLLLACKQMPGGPAFVLGAT